MIQQRHPAVARTLVHEFVGGQPQSVHLLGASMAAAQFTSLDGFEVPSWPALAAGDRRPLRNVEDFEPGVQRGGWQHEAAARGEWQFREQNLKPTLAEDDRALLRSQNGPMAGMSFSTMPTHLLHQVVSQAFRVLLLRRLRLPSPLNSRKCRCGRFLCSHGHHRASSGCPPMCGFAIWTSRCASMMHAGWRLLFDTTFVSVFKG